MYKPALEMTPGDMNNRLNQYAWKNLVKKWRAQIIMKIYILFYYSQFQNKLSGLYSAERGEFQENLGKEEKAEW